MHVRWTASSKMDTHQRKVLTENRKLLRSNVNFNQAIVDALFQSSILHLDTDQSVMKVSDNMCILGGAIKYDYILII